MSCKALLVLVMFMVTILLTASEEAPRVDLDEKFDQNYGNNNDPEHALDKSKQYHGHRGGGISGRGSYGGGFGGRGGYGGPRRAGGARDGGSDGCPPGGWCCVPKDLKCLKCCLTPHQSANETNNIDAKTHA
ncbi:hypothetical protein PIB30_084008 [Stylosanthes scabra]|uniref:Glycine-rich protein n=1 Tax=Stylosanthes scabra TaxID=79078 RepID=A0ABU6TV94_9FABA|nr:hypothetical protein [Stylosanthes scabra]